MKKSKELIAALKKILDKGESILPVKVVSVDKVNDTCNVEFDDLEIGNIRLKATINENTKGVVAYPVIDSIVLIEKLSDEEFFVTKYTEVDAYKITIGDSFYMIDVDGFTIKKGNDSLKDALTLIVQAVQQIVVIYGNNTNYQKLQEALTKINNILQ